MPDDHSEVVPLLPIPNRTVKRLCADDSADSRVKVGHRQALTARKAPSKMTGLFLLDMHQPPSRRTDVNSRKSVTQENKPQPIDLHGPQSMQDVILA